MAIEGVDYAWSRPDIAGLVAAGKAFACRYGGPGSDGKHLHVDEAAALSAAGVAIVANAEGAADGLLGGWSAGADWARRADAHFRACGMPPDRPIYLSVDFDVTSTQWPAVREALKGAASVIGAGRVGVYGGRRAIEWARRDGVARWFWQTYAWSGGYWVPGNHIEQYRNGVQLAGATLDLDRALIADFGQWTIGDDAMDAFREAAIEYVDTRLRGLISGERVTTAVKPGNLGAGEEILPNIWLQKIMADMAELKATVAALTEALKGGVTVPAKVDLSDGALEAVEGRVRDVAAAEHEAAAAAASRTAPVTQ